MRLWSLHPRYLDAKGLTACWREALLARSVLRGETSGYTRHPQLERFRNTTDPLAAIEVYLHGILVEAIGRGYRFDTSKISPGCPVPPIKVTSGQMQYEQEHLRKKLTLRDPSALERLGQGILPEPHPSFTVVPGEVEPWEVRVPDRKTPRLQKNIPMKNGHRNRT